MIGRFLKGLAKIVATLVVIVVIAAAVAVAAVELSCQPEAPSAEAAAGEALSIDDPGYLRTGANTYWTFPEWYIVYSFEDFGAFLETKPESAFPYFGQIAGFWQSFCAANRVAAALPGDHFQYKLMIYVIGLSYTFEFAIKGAWENTIGRLTELFRGPAPAAEDVYARGVVQDYAQFLRQVPWYEYPFMDKLAGLWRETPIVGDSPVRNIERKASLSAEYLVKAGYAKAIAAALAAGFEPADLEIMFVARGDVDAVLLSEPDVRLVRQLPDGSALLVAPRYRAFTDMLKRQAENIDLVEIAGNRRILMTAIVPEAAASAVEGMREMFRLPIDSQPGFYRVGYDVDVAALMPALRGQEAAGLAVEHLYDY